MEFIWTGGLHFVELDIYIYIYIYIYIRTGFFHLAVLLDEDFEYFPNSIRFLPLLTGLGSAYSGVECRLLLLITDGYGLILRC